MHQFPVVLIPAYKPNAALLQVVKILAASGVPAIVIVDDGTGPEGDGYFAEVAQHPQVTCLRHAVNLGKGAALRTGINHILCHYPKTVGVVTVDADGQHSAEDVLQVCATLQASPDSLVMGVRSFRGKVPFRSRFGNQLTRGVMRIVLGRNLSDTQTGLRGIPRSLLTRLLKIPAAGYEFELEMLIAAKHFAIPVIEQPIQTIYEPGNPTSHFQPLRDSMKIYFVLLRFSLVAMMTAAIDNVLFYALFAWSGSIIGAQAGGRIAAVLFNYSAVRKAAFLSEERHRVVLPRYLLLVAFNALLSYAGIRFLTGTLSMGVFPAKLLIESILFIANFAIQRDFVFTRREGGSKATNWDRYYQSVPPTAHLTRRYTQSILNQVLQRLSGPAQQIGTIVEIGGANSCFLDSILRNAHPAAYHVVDRNEYGLALLEQRVKGRDNVVLHQGDVLNLAETDLKADVVFSVGLIEHFDRPGTLKAIAAHFQMLRSGGWAIISYPTPTWLYSSARAICEACGLWQFPDERPLLRDEVLHAMQAMGEVVYEKTLWPLVFTQHMVVVRKG
jgi:putative flippase GtrA